MRHATRPREPEPSLQPRLYSLVCPHDAQTGGPRPFPLRLGSQTYNIVPSRDLLIPHARRPLMSEWRTNYYPHSDACPHVQLWLRLTIRPGRMHLRHRPAKDPGGLGSLLPFAAQVEVPFAGVCKCLH